MYILVLLMYIIVYSNGDKYSLHFVTSFIHISKKIYSFIKR